MEKGILKIIIAITVTVLILAFVPDVKASNIRIDLSGGTDGFIFHYGNPVEIRITLSQPSYLIVYALNMDGEVKILFPNIDRRNNYVTSRSITINRHYNLLADMQGPLFITAIASRDRRLMFSYQSPNIGLWSHYWGSYHPNASFISHAGFGRENMFPVVLERSLPGYHNPGNYNYNYHHRGPHYYIPYDQISRDFRNFNRIINYFIDDLNEAVMRLNIDLAYHTADMYVLSHRQNTDPGSVFDSYLYPYGQWLYLDGMRVWKPYVPYWWRPFVHGYWRWSPGINNWVWISFEPWNLIYYYGFWYYDFRYGWVWIPDFEWHPPNVVFYYYDGYIGWRPGPLPHVYHSRINSYSYSQGGMDSYNHYVFVHSSSFGSDDISKNMVSGDVYERQIKPGIASGQASEYNSDNSVRLYNTLISRDNIPVKTIDLEKSQISSNGSSRFEVLLPRLDSSEKENVERSRKELIRDIEKQKQQSPPVQHRGSAVAERDRQGKVEGPVKRDNTRKF